jgi:crossover junction endodeoxyribonuclease RusA
VHWAVKSKAAKAYKQACFVLAKEARLTLPELRKVSIVEALSIMKPPQYHLWAMFYPPDKRLRDDDNVFASFKNGRDGLALALGIDDRHFISRLFLHTEIGGMVKVKITGGPND